MGKPPKVSVVMPVRDGMPYLQEATRSVLGQTLTDLEFIIVDDASTDATWRTLSSIASEDGRVLLMRNESRAGISVSRNRAIATAHGEYIACQDADDISIPQRLAKQAGFLDSNPQIGVVGTWLSRIDSEGVPLELGRYPLLIHDADIQRHLLYSSCLVAVMVRRVLMERAGGFDPFFEVAEDYDLWLRLAELTQLANIPEPLYLYRQHARSMSKTRYYLQLHSMAIALERAILRREGENPPQELRDVLARQFLRAAFVGLAIGEEASSLASVHEAVGASSTWSRSGAMVEAMILRLLASDIVPDQVGFVEAVFTTLLPRTPHLGRTKARILSSLHIDRLFGQAKMGSYDAAAESWVRGVRNDPRWLSNRGVLSLGFRLLVRRHLPWTTRIGG